MKNVGEFGGKILEMCEYNMKVFSNQTIGVHGHELPKFSESEFKEFWKYNEGWVENPEYQSRVEMLENKKYWKKNEDLLIKDFKEEIPDPDEFKKTHIPIEKNSDLIIKVNNLNHFFSYNLFSYSSLICRIWDVGVITL